MCSKVFIIITAISISLNRRYCKQISTDFSLWLWYLVLDEGLSFLYHKEKEGGFVDEQFMQLALQLAQEAAAEGEVPVGCVIVKDGQVVGTGRNRRETGKSALAHAEIEAIANACKTLGGWRLWQCTLYVTLEPCPMCAGAIVNARIPRVVFGAKDSKCGACGSVCDIFQMDFNHHPQVESGILQEQCSEILKDFFKKLRQKK